MLAVILTNLILCAQIDSQPITTNSLAPSSTLSEVEVEQLRVLFKTLEKEYQQRLRRSAAFVPADGRSRYSAEADEARRLIAERVGGSAQKQRDLRNAILLTDDSGFAHIALAELIDLFARQGDRQALVALLSKRCPERIGLDDSIEALLIVVHRGELSDGTLVLCEAFDESHDDDVRHNLAEALRRGFKFTGITSDDDRQLIDRVRRWYKHNSDRYKPNLDYVHHWNVRAFPYETSGVLVPKTRGSR